MQKPYENNFNGEKVLSVCEFKVDKFLVCVEDDDKIYILDREKKKLLNRIVSLNQIRTHLPFILYLVWKRDVKF